MSKPINEPRMVQQALVSDEDLSFELWRPWCRPRTGS